MCLNIGTPNNHYFSFETNGKVVVFGVPILKHFRVNGYFVSKVNLPFSFLPPLMGSVLKGKNLFILKRRPIKEQIISFQS